MGILYTAARDPIFFAHHANVDQMWTIWKTLQAKRKKPYEFKTGDWNDAAFYFYDENAEIVRVKVSDSLDNTKLGYQYEDVKILWLQSRPTPLGRKITKDAVKAPPVVVVVVLPKALMDSKIAVEVKREKKSRSKAEKEMKEELLVIEGIEFESSKYVKFDVYVNDEEESGPSRTEFAGNFLSVPHRTGGKNKMKSRFQIGITELLEDIGADDDELVVVLVPKTGIVTINGPITIEFYSGNV